MGNKVPGKVEGPVDGEPLYVPWVPSLAELRRVHDLLHAVWELGEFDFDESDSWHSFNPRAVQGECEIFCWIVGCQNAFAFEASLSQSERYFKLFGARRDGKRWWHDEPDKTGM